MYITDIVQHNKNKYKIYVDYEFAFVLYKGELHKYHIQKGEVISETVYRELTDQILPKRAKLRAMNLLTKRPYTEKRLREKLEAGLHSKTCIDIAIAYVKSFGYLDDRAYARDYIAYHIANVSVKVLEQKLIQKGVGAHIVRECLDEIGTEESADAQQKQILQLFQKKFHGKIPQDMAEKTKIVNFFLRKGYSISLVKRVLSNLSLDDLYN